MESNSDKAVSYTHLDVYKRQRVCRLVRHKSHVHGLLTAFHKMSRKARDIHQPIREQVNGIGRSTERILAILDAFSWPKFFRPRGHIKSARAKF